MKNRLLFLMVFTLYVAGQNVVFSQVSVNIGAPSLGVVCTGPIPAELGGFTYQKVGIHYNACEIQLYPGASLNQFKFKLTSSNLTDGVGFPLTMRYRDSNALTLIPDEPWQNVVTSTVNASATGIYNSASGILTITLSTGAFFSYAGEGFDLFLQSDITALSSVEGYQSPQCYASWSENFYFGLGSNKPALIAANSVGTFYPGGNLIGSFTTTIETCGNQSSYCNQQEICLYLHTIDGNNQTVLFNESEISGTFSWTLTPTSGGEVISFSSTTPHLEISQGILSDSTTYNISCIWSNTTVNLNISNSSLVIGGNLDCYSEMPSSGEMGSRIVSMKLDRYNVTNASWTPLLESNTNVSDGNGMPQPFQYNVFGQVGTDILNLNGANGVVFNNDALPTTVDFSQAMLNQGLVPKVKAGDELRLQLVMNKGAKPMMNHRVFSRFDFNGDGIYEVERISDPNTGIPNFNTMTLPQTSPQVLNLNSETISYTHLLIVPCDINSVGDSIVKFQVGLKRLPTGWDDGEEYIIKTLCPTPTISWSEDTICANDPVVFYANIPGGCDGQLTWYNAAGDSVGSGVSFSPTISGSYYVRFVNDDCDKSSAVRTIVVLPYLHQFVDSDGDGFGNPLVDTWSCDTISGYVLNNTDCDDTNASLISISAETCNNFDDDCDGLVDDGLTFTNYYADIDGDGFGAGVASNLCSNPGAGYVTNNTDCDDTNASLNSISAETCNNFDDDCDGLVDDGLSFVNYYNDADGDTYGAGSVTNACQSPGAGYVTNNTDCDDTNASLNSISAETCNNFDDDCDGLVDDGLSFVNYYNDADGDAYGAGSVTNACQSPGASYVTINTDCNDALNTVNPSVTETCNSIDDDCDGLADEGCSAGSLISATLITSLPQFGLTGGNYSQNVNMAAQTDTPEYGGTYPEKWFKFVAQSNAVRIAVTGASSADDNAVAVFDDPGLSYSTPLIPIATADAVNLSSTGVFDQGNEILLTDQLVEGNTYYVVVATVNGTAGNINVKFNTLLPSTCDIAAYTGGTNTYSNVCSNFKCRYRQNAKQGIVHRWASNTTSGIPLQSYTIPPSSIMFTVCQLAKFVPANISGSAQTIYVSADVQYELADAAGVIHYLTAVSTTTCSFTLNPEASIGLRSTDACPNFKTTMSSLATDRSVCGTTQYQWEFTMAYPSPGLPINVSGAPGGSRILGVNSIPGIANGQRYDLRIRSLHNDAVTYSGWSASPSCFKTLGAAGMVPWSSEEEQKEESHEVAISLYPNPSLQGKGAILRSSDMIESIQIFNSSGQLLAKANGTSSQGLLELPAMIDAGLYWVVVKTGDDIKRLAWLVQ